MKGWRSAKWFWFALQRVLFSTSRLVIFLARKGGFARMMGGLPNPPHTPRSVEKGWAVQYWEVLCKIRKKQCHYECKTLEKAPLRCRRDNDQKSMTITQGNNAIIGREASSSILWHLIIEFTQKTHANKKQRTNH
jgi:hypothetical protein